MLDGFRIIEIEGLGPAPFAGMMLADLGADVIVVHRPDPAMATGGERNTIDRGKRSIVLDLKSSGDIATLKRLIATADGVIEGFRPGVMERLGLGPNDLATQNPKLVYGRMTGWGQDGPRAHLAGHDLNYLALTGALWFSSETNDTPYTPPTMQGDIGGGALYLVIGMLSGLLRAQMDGKSTVVDAAIVDGAAHAMNLLMTARAAGVIGHERGTGMLDGAPWSRCYQTRDARWLAVQCLEPKFYDAFLEGLGLDSEAGLEQQLDPSRWPAMARRFGEVIAERTLADWTRVFTDSDACVAPVLSPEESATDPHMVQRGVWQETDLGLQASTAPRFDGQPSQPPAPAPRRGEHTDAILAEIGQTGQR